MKIDRLNMDRTAMQALQKDQAAKIAQADKLAKRPPPRGKKSGFEQDSLVGLAWTQVKANSYPHNRKTICCDEKARAGQMVVAIPSFQNGELMGTAIVHGKCLKAYLEEVPDDIDVVEETVERIVRDLSRD